MARLNRHIAVVVIIIIKVQVGSFAKVNYERLSPIMNKHTYLHVSKAGSLPT